jgi:hypothetical protein
MENITGFMGIKKPVIPEEPQSFRPRSPLQIPHFLQKCKKEKTTETILPHDNTKTQPV